MDSYIDLQEDIDAALKELIEKLNEVNQTVKTQEDMKGLVSLLEDAQQTMERYSDKLEMTLESKEDYLDRIGDY